jgi:hypothetical protein
MLTLISVSTLYDRLACSLPTDGNQGLLYLHCPFKSISELYQLFLKVMGETLKTELKALNCQDLNG